MLGKLGNDFSGLSSLVYAGSGFLSRARRSKAHSS